MKEIPVQEAELAALMDDLESMLAAADGEKPPVQEEARAVAEPAGPVEPEQESACDEADRLYQEAIEAEEAMKSKTVEVATQDSVATATGAAVVQPSNAITVKIDAGEGAAMAQKAIDKYVTDQSETTKTAVYEPPVTKDPKTGLDYCIDVRQFQRDSRVSEENLDEAMMQQTGMRAFYGAQAAYAEAQATRAKAKFEVIEAKLSDEHRKALATTGEKVTEKMIEAAVHMDARWLKAKSYMIEAETIAQVNKSLSFAMNDRRDMLIQLGADRREEFKGGVRVLAQQQDRESLNNRVQAVREVLARGK